MRKLLGNERETSEKKKEELNYAYTQVHNKQTQKLVTLKKKLTKKRRTKKRDGESEKNAQQRIRFFFFCFKSNA